MGNAKSVPKIGFEDLQHAIKQNNIIINTLINSKQECLIDKTIPYNKEEQEINNLLKNNKSATIIIYGENCTDDTVYKKYKQLTDLGFTNIYIYPGGLFEWLLLQDIYGEEPFPTTSYELEHLKFSPPTTLLP